MAVFHYHAREPQAIFRSYPASHMARFKIGPKIGNVRDADAALVEPVA